MKSKLLTPALALYILPCILLWQIFCGGCLLPANLLHDIYPWRTGNPKDLVPWNVLQFDGITQFYPWRLFGAESWHSGYIPLWNPHQFCGTPFLANGQSAVLYPPNILFELIPVKFAFGWSALLHLTFTGVAAYNFFRRANGVGRWASTIGAACWQLSTWQVSWLALPTFLCTSAWLPLALLLVYYLARKPTVPRSVALGCVIALMILAGHLQIAFYCLLLTVAYAIYQVLRQRLFGVRLMQAIFVVVLVAGLLTASQMLPTIELSKLSPRTGGGATASGYHGYVALAMPTVQLAALIVPKFFGSPVRGTYWGATNFAENAGYVGAFSLMLSIIALVKRRAVAERLFFAIAGVLALLIAIGTPLNALLYFGIPGFSATGSPARILVLWTFCASTLAAFGADDLIKNPKAAWPGIGVFILLAAGTVGISCVALLRQNSGFIANIQAASNDIRAAAGFVIVGMGIIYLYDRKTISTKIAPILVFGLASLDLLIVNNGYNPVVSPADVYPVTSSISWLQQHAGFDRIMPINRNWNLTDPPNAVLPPNGATVYGLYDIQGYDSLQTKSYKEFTNELDGGVDSSPPENGNMDFANGVGSADANLADGKYITSMGPLPELGTPEATDDVVNVYINADARPIGGDAQIVREASTRADFQANGPFDSAIQWYPGWKAFRIGSSDVPLACAAGPKPLPNAAQPPIIHVAANSAGIVELRFEPDSFRVGLYLSLIGLLFAAGSGARYKAQPKLWYHLFKF